MTKKRLSTFHSIGVVVFLLVCSTLIELSQMYFSSDPDQIFRFHRTGIAEGEVWRLLTGHLDHLGWEHLFLNAVFFALISLLFERLFSAYSLLSYWLISCLSISVLLLFYSPNLVWYVGLSGSLYSLLMIGLIADRSYPLSLRGLILIVLLVKITLEQLNMNVSAISEFIGGPVAVDSHFYGVLVGIAISIGILLKNYGKRRVCGN